MQDDDLQPTPEELRAAEELRKALESHDPRNVVRMHANNEEADLLHALKASHEPASLSDEEHDAIITRALQKKPEKRGVVIRVSFGVAAALAIAAGVILFIRTQQAPPTATRAPLVRVRSTQELFNRPFDRGEASA